MKAFTEKMIALDMVLAFYFIMLFTGMINRVEVIEEPTMAFTFDGGNTILKEVSQVKEGKVRYWGITLSSYNRDYITAQIPNKYLKGSDIYYVSSLPATPMASGIYYDRTNEILILDKGNNATTHMERVLWHEVGHHWYYYNMSKDERKEWVKLYENKTSFVTQYASTKATEDYAEVFTCSFNKEYYNGKCTHKLTLTEIEFIERTVGIDITDKGTTSTSIRWNV